jgi:SET domain-containing protein
MYRPLPDFLTIKKSDIEGLGLYATKDITSGTDLGVTHILYVHDKIIRTPLGGFYNHSDNPNCKTYRLHGTMSLRTIKHIKRGDEITAKYTLYQVDV